MHFLKFLLCFFFIMLILDQVWAQLPGKMPAKIDSINGQLSNRLNNNQKYLADDLKDLKLPSDTLIEEHIGQGILQVANPITNDLKGAYTNALSKVKLFDKQGLKLNGGSGEFIYNYMKDTSGMSLGVFKALQFTTTYSAGFDFSIAQIPVNIGFKGNNGVYDFSNPPTTGFYKFNFQPEKYLENVKGKILEKITPENVTSIVTKRINDIKAKYENKLKREIDGVKNDLLSQSRSALNLPNDITDLSVTDVGALKNKILSQEETEKYKHSEEYIQETLKNKNAATLAGDSNFIKMTGNVKRYEALQKIYKKIISTKQQFDDNSMVKELRKNLPFSPGNFKSYLADKKNLKEVLSNHANLSSLQKLFLNITHLDIGQSAVQSGQFSLQGLMNKGVNTEFQDEKRSVGFIYGKNKNTTNNWLQGGLTSAVGSEYTSITGFKFGSGYGSRIQQSVSVNLFDYKAEPNPGLPGAGVQSNFLPLPSRKDAVISYNNSFTIAGVHKINIDLSKSLGAFTDNIGADSAGFKTNAFSSLFSNAGKANFATAIDYAGELLKTDISLSFKKVGLGYSNPGNSFLRRGESRVGLGLSRNFIDERLKIKMSIDFRKQNFDPAKNYSFAAFSDKFQVSYKINRSSKVGLTYQHSNYSSVFYDTANTPGGTSRLQGDGSYKFFLAGKKIINNATLSYQQFDFPALGGEGNYKSNTLMLMHTSSIVLNKNLLSVTLLMNRSSNAQYYFNTSMFSLESNYTYTVIKNIKMSSALGYYANDGWNKQLGVKQQFSVALFEKMNIDFDAGYRKAIQVTKAELSNQLFVNSTMHYNF